MSHLTTDLLEALAQKQDIEEVSGNGDQSAFKT